GYRTVQRIDFLRIGFLCRWLFFRSTIRIRFIFYTRFASLMKFFRLSSIQLLFFLHIIFQAVTLLSAFFASGEKFYFIIYLLILSCVSSVVFRLCIAPSV